VSLKSTPVGKKIKAVPKVVSGEKIQLAAREIGVHRTSIYIRKGRALAGLEETLGIS